MKSKTLSILEKKKIIPAERDLIIRRMIPCIGKSLMKFSREEIKQFLQGEIRNKEMASVEIFCIQKVLLWGGYDLSKVPESIFPRAKKFIPIPILIAMDLDWMREYVDPTSIVGDVEKWLLKWYRRVSPDAPWIEYKTLEIVDDTIQEFGGVGDTVELIYTLDGEGIFGIESKKFLVYPRASEEWKFEFAQFVEAPDPDVLPVVKSMDSLTIARDSVETGWRSPTGIYKVMDATGDDHAVTS